METFLTIDTSGSCNLRCPSCPMGRRDQRLAHEFLTLERLSEILAKLRHEGVRVLDVMMQSWTEPTLHPNLSGLIDLVHSFGHPVSLSSHLNNSVDWGRLMASEPEKMRISVSGFT